MTISKKEITPLFIAATLLIFILGGTGIIGKKITLASPMEGRLVDGSTPLGGITVTRNVHYAMTNTRRHQETITDTNGVFIFPQEEERIFFTSLLPHEIVIKHTYEATIADEKIEFLRYRKDNYVLDGELGERMFVDNALTYNTRSMKVECDMSKDANYDQGEETLFWSNCLERSAQ